MPSFDPWNRRTQALILISVLGIGLAIALWPYLTGLVGAIVMFVITAPVHGWLSRRLRPRLAATLVVILTVILLLGPGLSVTGLVVSQAQQLAGSLMQSPIFGQLQELHIGQYELGPQLMSLGQKVISWIGSSALDLVGTATRMTLNLTIAMFGLYYLLIRPNEIWAGVAPYIPFSPANTRKLRQRFRDVTYSTLIGTGLTAVTQGALVAGAFSLVGLPSAFFWGVITAVFAILPVVGSGLIWGPGALALFLGGRYLAGIGIALWGLIVVASVDNVIRPWVYNRWAKIHPFLTLVGALGGIKFFGLLGLLIGPLALSYFFELIAMYREEYFDEETEPDVAPPDSPAPAAVTAPS